MHLTHLYHGESLLIRECNVCCSRTSRTIIPANRNGPMSQNWPIISSRYGILFSPRSAEPEGSWRTIERSGEGQTNPEAYYCRGDSTFSSGALNLRSFLPLTQELTSTKYQAYGIVVSYSIIPSFFTGGFASLARVTLYLTTTTP